MRWKLSCNHTGSLLSHQYTNPNPAPGPLHWLHLKHSSPQSAWLTPSLLEDCFQIVILSESTSLTSPFNIAHMHTHPHIHTHSPALLHTNVHTDTRTQPRACTHHIFTCVQTYTHAWTHALVHTPTHTHAHTHTTPSPLPSFILCHGSHHHLQIEQKLQKLLMMLQCMYPLSLAWPLALGEMH